MDTHMLKVKSVRSLSDFQTVTLHGEGNFVIGLSSEESLEVCLEEVLAESGIVVPLFMVSVWKTSGTTFRPINRDLKCYVCDQLIQQECHLNPGSKIEVGDKSYEFLDGPAPRPRKSRSLPPTPGIHVSPSPPSKPCRYGQLGSFPQQTETEDDQEGDWCMLHLPGVDEELLSHAHGSPDKMVQAAVRFVSRQINQHTGTRMTSHLHDSIFKLFQDVEDHRPDSLEGFLGAVAVDLAKLAEGEKDGAIPGPIIAILTETLTWLLEPMEHAVTCLGLLRSLSQIESNLHLFLSHGTSAAVLGSMAVLRDSTPVQQHCLDILARLAILQPSFHDPVPLKETAVELVNLAMTQHPRDLHVTQAGCRVLANLCHSAFGLAFQILETGRHTDPNHQAQLERVISVLHCLQAQSSPIVKAALAAFATDLSVATEVRRFLFFLGKLDQLHVKRSAWLSRPAVDDEPESGGILKKSRSFENLRHPDRRVCFEDWGSECLSSTDSESCLWVSGGAEILSHSSEPLIMPVHANTDSVDAASTAAQEQSENSMFTPQPPPRSDPHKPMLPPRQPANRSREIALTVDYTKADLIFLQQLTFAQAACLVCSLAFHDKVGLALKLLDQPLQVLVKETSFTPEVQEFVQSQYSQTLTLMDLQPALVIALVDAVRYSHPSSTPSSISPCFPCLLPCCAGRSVALTLLRERVLEVLRHSEAGPCHDHSVLASALLASMQADPALAPTLTDAEVSSTCITMLKKLESTSPNNSHVQQLMKHFTGLLHK